MFEMATGSGKTLVMAGLILECYKQGYQNFIFFVNSANILEKRNWILQTVLRQNTFLVKVSISMMKTQKLKASII